MSRPSLLTVIRSCFNVRLSGSGQGLLHHRRSSSRWLREPPDDERRGEVLLLPPVALQLLPQPPLLPLAAALLAGGGGQGCRSAHQFSWQTFTELTAQSNFSHISSPSQHHQTLYSEMSFTMFRWWWQVNSNIISAAILEFPLICLRKTSWLLAHSHSPLRVNLTSLCFPRFNFSFLMNKIIMDSPSST